MGAESIGAGQVAGDVAKGSFIKGGSFFLHPFSKTSLIIFAIIFFCSAIVGVYESFATHSLFPLADRTIFTVAGADSQLGSAVDNLESSARPVSPSSMFSKAFPTWLWFWLKWWVQVFSLIFFIYFLFFIIYYFWYLTNSSLILRNILLTVATFIVVSMFVGMIFFNLSLAGSTIPADKSLLFSKQMAGSYPMHGTIKFFKHFITKDLFYKVDEFARSPFGQVITKPIPSANINLTENISGGI